MRILYILIAVALFGSACSKEDPVEVPIEEETIVPEVETPQNLPYGLTVDVMEVDILQMVTFKLIDSASNDEGNFFSFLKYKVLDSLIWNVEEATNKVHLVEHKESGFGVRTEWAHNFYSPGTYMTYLKGYTEGVQVVSDSILVTVRPSKKDFLNLNWSEVPVAGNPTTGYANNDVEDYIFSIFPRLTDGIRSAHLYTFFQNLDRNANSSGDVPNQAQKVLTDYISKMYGQPTYTIGNSDLARKYAENFKRRQAEVSVIKIWKTLTTNIALLREVGEHSSTEEYFIYAEPNT